MFSFNFKFKGSELVKKGTCVQIGNVMIVSEEDYEQMKNSKDVAEILSNIKLIKKLPAFDLFYTDVFKASLNA